MGDAKSGISLHNSAAETCEAGPEFGESPCLVEHPAKRHDDQQIVRLGPLGPGDVRDLGTYLLIRSKVVVISTAGSGSFNGPIFHCCPAEMWAELFCRRQSLTSRMSLLDLEAPRTRKRTSQEAGPGCSLPS